jgi:hypothetical protein
MALPAPFARVEELQNTLQRPDLPKAGALLALSRASDSVRGHCHWTVSREVVTDAQPNTGRGRHRLWLPTLHLVSVDEVTEGGLTLTAGQHFTWDQHGVVYRNGRWPYQLNAVVLTYTHGYAEDHRNYRVAHDVTLAAAARICGNPLRHSSEQTGSEAWVSGIAQADATLSKGEREQLDSFTLDTA